jgi:hypothetical protein
MTAKITIADAEGYAVRAKIKNQRDAASYVPMTDTFTDTVGALLSAHLSTPGGAVWTKKAATNDFKIDATGGKIMLTTASVAIASYFSRSSLSEEDHVHAPMRRRHGNVYGGHRSCGSPRTRNRSQQLLPHCTGGRSNERQLED